MKLLVLILVWAFTLVARDARRVPFETALAEVVELTEADRHEEALAAAQLLVVRVEDPALVDEALDDAAAEDPALGAAARDALDAVRIVGLGEPERAAAHYALGVVRSRSEDHAVAFSAALEFESSRALAGPGELRLDATYNLGGAHLAEAERLRATLPEIAGGAAPASTPGLPPMSTGGAGDEEQPDPLPLARAAYETARGFLVERLRADWRDADTRANLELIQRRLRELDEIERQREEREQEQEQQQEEQGEDDQQQDQQQESEPNEDQEGEPSDSQDDSSAQEDPSAEQQGERDEQADQPPEQTDEPQPGEQEQPEPGQPPEPSGTEEQPPAQPESASQGEPEERVLTREEVMRLLDRLAELEEQGRALEAALRKARRTPVARDW